MLIHINGMPGVGKLTVSKLLAEKLSMHLVDNHSLINTVYATGYKNGSEDYLRVLTKVNQLVYQELASNTRLPDVIMTNCLVCELASDQDRFLQIKQLADARKELFVPVFLKCSQAENNRRIIFEQRKNDYKLTDIEILKSIRDSSTVIHPETSQSLKIDTTSFTVEQTACLIAKHIEKFL